VGARISLLPGGGSGRIDHLLGIALFFARAAPPSRWLTDYEEVRLIEREAEFSGWRGCTVSIFPVGKRAARMRSEGLQWPLDGLVFRRGFGGISNRATADRVRITVGVGRLLVIRSLLSDAGHRMPLNDADYRVDLNDAEDRVARNDEDHRVPPNHAAYRVEQKD